MPLDDVSIGPVHTICLTQGAWHLGSRHLGSQGAWHHESYLKVYRIFCLLILQPLLVVFPANEADISHDYSVILSYKHPVDCLSFQPFQGKQLVRVLLPHFFAIKYCI